jgi:hypothetical protein
VDFLWISSIFLDFDRFGWISWIPGARGPSTPLDGSGALLSNSPLVLARLVRRQDLRSQGGLSIDFIDFLRF